MAVRWSFFAFDCERFAALEPTLRRASETGDFTRLGIPEADAALERVAEDATPEEAANELALDLCGVGDALFFDSGVPSLIRSLRRSPDGEEAGDLLAGLISAGPNIDDWLRCEGGLVGILLPDQTKELAQAIRRFRASYRVPPPPRGLAGLGRRLASTTASQERLAELMDLIEETAAQGLGLAALREG